VSKWEGELDSETLRRELADSNANGPNSAETVGEASSP